MSKYESYDGGWDKTQKKFTPKFVPFSEKPVNGYDVPIAVVQRWVEDNVPEKRRDNHDHNRCKATAGARDESLNVPKKAARVRPGPIPPQNTVPVIASMRCGK